VGRLVTGAPVGYCGRHESPLVETLHELSLLISLAPPLLPSYAVAFLLVAYGGVVQHAIEEPAEQVQQFQLPMQFHGALELTFALDEDAHVLLGGDDGPDEAAAGCAPALLSAERDSSA
jgi:hypothetical protein